ncbi:MAG: adenylate/guanylate cyclase domain-containing protein [Deltaproteobacteria bacterium]|nr:adenylate/guanylate cyclase domain-containing protein [Deltaproteobacteria bacterium]
MNHDSATAFQHWLLTTGRQAANVPALLDLLGEKLHREAQVDRIWIGTTLLHPQTAAHTWVWTPETPAAGRSLGHNLYRTLAMDLNSPARRLELGAPFVRYRRALDEGQGFEDVVALWDKGFTDFYGLSLRSKGRWMGGVTLSTRAPDGFSPTQIELFDAVMPALEATLESLIKDLVTSGLLQTYLGRDAGERVFKGQVKRGDGETIEAVVWFSDVRGFTRLSAQLDRSALLQVLNDVFELLVDVIDAHGGEVLKFMGDGLLGVFPAGEDSAAACRAARMAATAFRARLQDLSAQRVNNGLAPIDAGVGLHYGNVTYGNIGAPARLDFTVIGPAVNLASRIEGLCGALSQPILASEGFVALEGGAWETCGHFEVKGVETPILVARPVD